MCTNLKVLSESLYLTNTNMTGFRCFSKIFALDESSLSNGRVKLNHIVAGYLFHGCYFGAIMESMKIEKN